MSVRTWLAGLFRNAATTIDPIHPRDPALAKMFGGGNDTFSGVRVNHDRVVALPAVIRGVSIVSNSMMKLPLYVFREEEEGREWDRSHPSWQAVTRKPHPDITDGMFRQTLTAWAMIWGNAYAFIDRPNWPAGPVTLVPMLPDRTFPYRVGRGGAMTTDVANEQEGMLRYATRIGTETRTVDASEVLHIRGLGPNPYIGWDIVHLLKETFGGAMASQEFGHRFFGQGANPAGFVEMDGSLQDEEAEERFINSLRKATSGLAKSHKLALLEEGAKFKPWTIEPEKAQFLETKQLDIRLLAMAIGIKVHKLIDGANSAFKSLEQANEEHRDDDLVPWICRWREEMDDKLLTEEQKESGSHSIDVDDEAMTWVPYRERVAGTVEAYNNGLIEKDEGRRKLNFGPSRAARAKDFRIPANVIYEDDAAMTPVGPQPDDAPPPPTPPDEPDEDDEGDDARFHEVSMAYLGRIATRLTKAANAKAAKGTKEFIAWSDALAPESGPASIQDEINNLYSQVSAACYDCTTTAKSDDELRQTVAEATGRFSSFIERKEPCTS